MRKIILFLSVSCITIIVSCKKNIESKLEKQNQKEEQSEAYAKPICSSPALTALKQLPPSDYNDLKIKSSRFYAINSGSKIYRVPFISKDSTTDFVLIATDSSKRVTTGKVINIKATNNWKSEGVFTGQVTISSLNKTINKTYSIVKNKSQDTALFRSALVMAGPDPGGISVWTWFALLEALGLTGMPDNYYAPLQGGGGGGPTPPPSPDGCNTPESVGVEDEGAILFDYSNSGPGINLQKYLNCFNNIPDAGATYSIKLYADLPDNSNPDRIASGVTPGHAFITLTKTNGSSNVSQTFGFYPVSGPLSIFNVPVDSKIVDDGKTRHEFNASITMNLSQISFNTIKNDLAPMLAGNDYDLDGYNCTDFALQLFNYGRPSTDKIVVPDTFIQDFNGYYQNFGTTPNGLYKKLKEMKNLGGPQAANIQIGTFQAPNSYGACN